MTSINIILAIFSTCLVSVNGYTPHINYLDTNCGIAFTISRDSRLKLTFFSNTRLLKNWQCSATFKTSVPGDTLFVQYRSMDTDWSSNCRKNSLKILDSDKLTILNGPNGDCGGLPLITQFSSHGNSVSFQFQTDGSFQYGQFDILITSNFVTGINRTCPDDRFHCNNNRCISKQLHCNGFNDCGDYSDEHCPLSAGVIAGITIGVFVFIVLCIIGSVIGRRRRRYYRHYNEPPCGHQTIVTTYPPPQPSYQAYGR